MDKPARSATVPVLRLPLSAASGARRLRCDSRGGLHRAPRAARRRALRGGLRGGATASATGGAGGSKGGHGGQHQLIVRQCHMIYGRFI